MPTSSKRTANQQRQPSAPQDDAYDEYVSYSYHPKPAGGGGSYEYVQDRQQSADQYYDEPVPNNSAPMQRT
jgi:hypothetical protein